MRARQRRRNVAMVLLAAGLVGTLALVPQREPARVLIAGLVAVVVAGAWWVGSEVAYGLLRADRGAHRKDTP